MAKISDITAYPNQSPVALTDYLIGTDNTTKATKTFTVQDLANAIDDQVSLQEVLTVGNTDGGVGMSVTGASSFGNLTLTGTLTAGGGAGGTGGGGAGSGKQNPTGAIAGTANTGGGGGGGSQVNPPGGSRNSDGGGSGIVVIRYKFK